MYEQASAVADELGMDRADLDAWALRSHERASRPSTPGGWPRRSSPSRSTAAVRRSSTPRGPAPRHHAREARRARPLDPRASDAHGGQLAGRQRRRGDARRRHARSGAGARARAAGAHPRIGYTANRHDSLARVPAGAAQIALERAGLDRRRHGRLRDQRGVRLGRAAVVARPRRDPERSTSRAARSRSATRSARPVRDSSDAALPAAPPRRRARTGRHLLGRRAGGRDRDRGRRSVTAARVWSSVPGRWEPASHRWRPPRGWR